MSETGWRGWLPGEAPRPSGETPAPRRTPEGNIEQEYRNAERGEAERKARRATQEALEALRVYLRSVGATLEALGTVRAALGSARPPVPPQEISPEMVRSLRSIAEEPVPDTLWGAQTAMLAMRESARLLLRPLRVRGEPAPPEAPETAAYMRVCSCSPENWDARCLIHGKPPETTLTVASLSSPGGEPPDNWIRILIQRAKVVGALNGSPSAALNEACERLDEAVESVSRELEEMRRERVRAVAQLSESAFEGEGVPEGIQWLQSVLDASDFIVEKQDGELAALRGELDALRKQLGEPAREPTPHEALMDRDRLWCRALLDEGTDAVHRITSRFNALRPDQPSKEVSRMEPFPLVPIPPQEVERETKAFHEKFAKHEDKDGMEPYDWREHQTMQWAIIQGFVGPFTPEGWYTFKRHRALTVSDPDRPGWEAFRSWALEILNGPSAEPDPWPVYDAAVYQAERLRRASASE